jgi:hypothetical protein
MPGIEEWDLPVLFKSADQASLRAQDSFLRATRWRLGLAVSAAVFAAVASKVKFDGKPVLAYASAAAFVIALAVEVWLLTDRPEESWYDGRALAESAKTLAWRFAVGGKPFAHRQPNAEEYLERQLAELLEDAPNTRILPTESAGISEALRDLRKAPLEVRIATYLNARVLDQQQWYARKAMKNEKAGERWKQALIAIEVVGAVAAVLQALEVLDVDLTSIASTFIGVGVAWLAVKQHDQLARAYSFASHELSIARSKLEGKMTESEWSDAVAEAEEAISREHTMWRASHVVPDHASARRTREQA